tara:strand:+ start:1068 stop:1217 length:150 start_codon:yes stop_codon:yes gene_type:complete
MKLWWRSGKEISGNGGGFNGSFGGHCQYFIAEFPFSIFEISSGHNCEWA